MALLHEVGRRAGVGQALAFARPEARAELEETLQRLARDVLRGAPADAAPEAPGGVLTPRRYSAVRLSYVSTCVRLRCGHSFGDFALVAGAMCCVGGNGSPGPAADTDAVRAMVRQTLDDGYARTVVR